MEMTSDLNVCYKGMKVTMRTYSNLSEAGNNIQMSRI